MALPTDNIPEISKIAPTTYTASGASPITNPTIVQNTSTVPASAGMALGALMGTLLGSRGAGSANTQNQTNTETKPSTGGTSGGPKVNTPAGNTPGIGGTSVNNVVVPSNIPLNQAQSWLDQNYGTTNGQSNYLVSGSNISGNTAQAIGLPNSNISPSYNTSTGTSTGVTPDANDFQYYEDPGTGNIYDANGDLMLAFNNGYYYDPSSQQAWDINFDPVNSYDDLPQFDSSDVDTTSGMSGLDFSNYPDWANQTYYIKDGGSVRGLPTPLFANGGSVARFADGGTSFTDQVVANQMPQSVSTTTPSTTSNTSNTTNPPASTGGISNTISNLLGNSTVSGALLGGLLTQLLGGSSAPVNKGVDMSALATLKPRTSTLGPAKFVPYSQYSVPTTSADYSSINSNLGATPAPDPYYSYGTPVTPASSLSGGTTPTGGLPTTPTTTTPTTPATTTPSTTTPTTPIATTPTTTAPTYYADADGNIYDANGDLVFDTTSSGMAHGGRVKHFANGGLGDLAVTSLYDATNPDYVTAHEGLISQPGMATLNNQFGTVGYNMAYNSPETNAFYEKYSVRNPDGSTYISPEGFEYLYSQDPKAYATDAIVQDMPVDMPLAMGNIYDDSTDFPIRTMTSDTPLPYERVTTTSAPQTAPFSSSPTFRYSGANNPLLTGLRQQMPNQQPYMLMPDGTFAPREEISSSRQYGLREGGSPLNYNVPTSSGMGSLVPSVDGRQDYRQGSYVEGAGDGQSDDIPAMLADGEYVIDADTVAQLGNGSNKAGAKVLDGFRQNIRAHKRSAPHDKIPPKSKSALAYLKGAK